MNLTTSYLGITLRSPLVASASPLSEEIDGIKRLEDAGAGAVVLYSIFEEQIRSERYELHWHLTHGTESFPEALTYFPEPYEFQVGPEEYLKHIAKAKEAVHIPILASLNGSTLSGWTDFAKLIQQAGADALELNIYSIPTGLDLPGADVESNYFEILKAVRSEVTLPLAVKLSPFFTNFANFALRMEEGGADGLVLFNRFYQPDIDLESLEVTPNVLLSTPMAMRLPLRWIAILHQRLQLSLAASSGIHRGTDALKCLLAGADVTMLCSVLMQRGVTQVAVIEEEMTRWMQEHEYDSVEQLKGSMSQKHCADPTAFERAQYLQAISGRPPTDGPR